MDPLQPVTDLAKDAATCSSKWVYDQLTIVRHYKRNIERVPDKCKELKDNIAELKGRVEIGERSGEEIIPTIDEWLKKLQSYVQDEMWNDFMEQNVKALDKCCFGRLSLNLKYRYHISKKAIKEFREICGKIDDIVKHGSTPVTRPKNPPSLGSTMTAYYHNLETRELILKNIMDKITKDNVNIIGVHGMGGAGKTVLVNELARRVEDAKSFDRVIIVEITEAPNIKRIQYRIAERIGLQLNNVQTVEERAMRLQETLKNIKGEKEKKDNQQQHGPSEGKVHDKRSKILVVLDNVWQKLNLQEIGIPYGEMEEQRCKIVLTSRDENVCKTMGVHLEHLFDVENLKLEEAQILFGETVGERVKQAEYKSLEDELLKNCGGLPLAITTLANALKNQSISVWKRTSEELNKPAQANVTGLRAELYSILELSYNYIESAEKKHFFLLCCLFPLGHEIFINELMRYGIGLSLFKQVNWLVEAIEQAQSWADELKSSSLLLDGAKEKESVKIHDIIRLAAFNIPTKDGHMFQAGAFPRWLPKENYAAYTAISLSSIDNHEHLSGLKFPELQVLLLNCSHGDFPDNFFQGMRNLKVLVMSGMMIPTLPNSVECLGKLGTLHLEDCDLGDIRMIGELSNLLVLSLRNSRMKLLPKEVGDLRELKLLDLTNCQIFESMEAEFIANLTQLEGLYIHGIHFQNPKYGEQYENLVLKELRTLEHLNVMEADITCQEELPNDLMFNELSMFKIFARINLFPKNKTTWDAYTHVMELAKTDASRPIHRGLNTLLKKTEHLALDSVSGLTNGLHDLYKDGFMNLKSIDCMGCDGMEYLVNAEAVNQYSSSIKFEDICLRGLEKLKALCYGEPAQNLFCHLRRLFLRSLPSLQSIWGDNLQRTPTLFNVKAIQGGIYVFQNLQKLSIWDCSALESLFTLSIAAALVQLRDLRIWSCKNLKEIVARGDEVTIANEEIHTVFPKLQTLQLRNLDSLACFIPVNVKLIRPSLKELDLNEVNITTQPFFSKIDFPSLQNMYIDGVSEVEELWDLPFVDQMCTRATFSQLRELDVWGLPKLKFVWSEKFKKSSCFENLKDLCVSNCSSLKSVCSLSMAASLKQLESLTLYDNSTMEEIFSMATEEVHNVTAVNVFPKLHRLDLKYLPNLKHIYKGSEKIVFPSLRFIAIRGCGEGPSIQPFFTKQVGLPAIRDLVIYRSQFQEIWSNDLPPESYYQLEVLRVRYCNAVVNVIPLCTLERMQNLKELRVTSCEKVEKLFEFGHAQVTLTQLLHITRLELYKLPRLNCIPWKALATLNLRFLNISGLPLLTSLFSECIALDFRQLEEIHMRNCDSLEEIFSRPMESIDVACQHKFAFPRLKIVELDHLPRMCRFSSEKYDLKFPSLEHFKIKSCSCIKTFGLELVSNDLKKEPEELLASTSNVKEMMQESPSNVKVVSPAVKSLSFIDMPQLEDIWGDIHNGPYHWLQKLVVSGCEKLVKVIPFHVLGSLLNLEELVVRECHEVEELFEFRDAIDEHASMQLPKFIRLEIADLPKLNLTSTWNAFDKIHLRSLKINKFHDLRSLFSTSMAGVFVHLEDMKIEACESMEEIVEVPMGSSSTDEAKLVFPVLKVLKLKTLQNLGCFSSGSYNIKLPALENFRIEDCLKMKRFCSGSINTPKLRNAKLDRRHVPVCYDLNAAIISAFEKKENNAFVDSATTEDESGDSE